MLKENENRKRKRIVRDIELIKIQYYADYCHTRLKSLLPFVLGFFISFSVLFLTLFYEKLISPQLFLASYIGVNVFCYFYAKFVIRAYKKDFKRISRMIQIVKEGKELPKLEDLRKIELEKNA